MAQPAGGANTLNDVGSNEKRNRRLDIYIVNHKKIIIAK